MPAKRIPIAERFWAKVQKLEGEDACWVWTGSRDDVNGYGHIQIDRRPHLAHRVAFELQNGPIPDGHFVLHRCDNPPCQRGSHLFTGTAAVNMEDKVQKHRQSRGARHGRARLSAEQVAEMRRLDDGKRGRVRQLAKQFQISESHAWHLLRGDRNLWQYSE